METDVNSLCPFEKCLIPKTNSRYYLQLAILGIGYAFLCTNPKRMTGLWLMLFVSPLIVDLINLKSLSRPILRARMILIMGNVALAIFGLFEALGIFFRDSGIMYVGIEGALYVTGWQISKKTISIILFPDLFVPIMLAKFMPTQKSEMERLKGKKIAQEVHSNIMEEVN